MITSYINDPLPDIFTTMYCICLVNLLYHSINNGYFILSTLLKSPKHSGCGATPLIDHNTPPHMENGSSSNHSQNSTKDGTKYDKPSRPVNLVTVVQVASAQPGVKTQQNPNHRRGSSWCTRRRTPWMRWGCCSFTRYERRYATRPRMPPTPE